MALDQHAANLITTTVNAFNGDVTSVSPMDGISLIDSWLSILNTDPEPGNSVVSNLNDLKAELRSGALDGARIQRILNDLTQQVTQLASVADTDSKPELTTLSAALQGFSQQVGGTGKQANTGGQAPMTSTVGGESTNSGAGASALDMSDDDLSNRNGGTIR